MKTPFISSKGSLTNSCFAVVLFCICKLGNVAPRFTILNDTILLNFLFCNLTIYFLHKWNPSITFFEVRKKRITISRIFDKHQKNKYYSPLYLTSQWLSFVEKVRLLVEKAKCLVEKVFYSNQAERGYVGLTFTNCTNHTIANLL